MPNGIFRVPATAMVVACGPGTGIPTRSEIGSWTVAIDELSAAAEAYGTKAHTLETAVDEHVRHLTAPGGTNWAGDAANRAERQGYSDRSIVYGAADLIRKMRKVANIGAGDLRQALSAALDAIADAEAEDFLVSDNLTVTDKRSYTTAQIDTYEARSAAAEAHHSYICMRALQLATEDARVGAELTAGATELQGLVPPDWIENQPAISAVSTGEGDIKAYDSDTGGDEDALSGQEIADRLRELQRGQNRGVREVDTEGEIFDLYEEFTKGGEVLPIPDNYYDRRVLPDGTIIGVRESNDHGPTLDVKYPPGVTGPDKVHLPPPPLMPPSSPPAPGAAPVIASPPNLPVIDHPPVPGLLPPWAQTPAGIPQGPYPYGGLPPGAGVAAPDAPPLLPATSPGPDWIPTPSLPATPTPEEQAGIGGLLVGGLLAFLGWLGSPKVSF